MSITLSSAPRPLSFAGNRNAFRLAVSGIVEGGTAAHLSFTIRRPDAGSAFSIILGGLALRFYYSATADPAGNYPYRWHTAAELVQKLNDNYYLSPLFQASCTTSSDSFTVTLSARDVAHHDIELADFTPDLLSYSLNTGADRSLLPNYSLLARFELHDGRTTPWCRYYPSEGFVTIDCQPLSDFLPAHILPAIGAAYALRDIPLLRYRLQYAEAFGNPPLVQALRTTADWYTLHPGFLVQRFADADIPDWVDQFPAAPLSSNLYHRVRILGESTGRTVHICRNQPHYLYPIFMGSSGSDTAALHASLTVYAADGTATTSAPATLTLAHGHLYRLPVGPAAFSLPASAAAYTLTLSNADSSVAFRRTFIIRPSHLFTHQLLLQDRYGHLISFQPFTVSRSVTTTGDEIETPSRRGVTLSDAAEHFTATSAMMPRHEAERIADCLASPHHYIHAGGSWAQIYIKPASVDVFDEAEDLYTLSFEFACSDGLLHNIPEATLQSTTLRIDDPIDFDQPIDFNTSIDFGI